MTKVGWFEQYFKGNLKKSNFPLNVNFYRAILFKICHPIFVCN